LEEEPAFNLTTYIEAGNASFILDTNAIYYKEGNSLDDQNNLYKDYTFIRFMPNGRCYQSYWLDHFPTLEEIYRADTMAYDYYKIEGNILIREYASRDFYTRGVSYYKSTESGDIQRVHSHPRRMVYCNIKNASEIELIENKFGDVYKKYVFR
jgi:hypothetical protein